MNICPDCGSRDITGNACGSCGYAAASINGFDAFAPGLATAGPGYDPEHYSTLARLEAGNFWFRARNALILWAFGKFIPDARSYLEVGCGTGFVLGAIARKFPGLQVHGSEIFVDGLGFARQRVGKGHLFQMDARHIPFQETFDVIGAFDVIEHIEDDRQVLRQMHRALRPGGAIILTVPQHMWLWSSQDEVAHHVRRYTRNDLVEKVRAAGFRVTWTTSFVTLLLPVMAVARLGKGGGKPEDDPFAEFRLPRVLDALLLKVMQFEMALLRIGIRFPAGGSRILIAHRDET